MLPKNFLCLVFKFSTIILSVCEIYAVKTVDDAELRSYEKGIVDLKRNTGGNHEATNVDNSITREEQKYDFIIVGAGTAGSTLAGRLAEESNYKILVLEAGEPENEITKIPAMSNHLLSSKFNWGYYTIPQKHWAHESEDRRSLLGMGKAVGGSTAINGMFWCRGDPSDYDRWNQNNLTGWNYNDILPFFKKVENATGVKYYTKSHQGSAGPVHLENSRFQSRATEAILRSAYELRIPYVNYNVNQAGIGHAQGTLKNGKRWSAASAYMKERLNLTVRKRSFVLKVLIDENEKRAFGVRYVQDGQIRETLAMKEVILSTGGMMTPKLLILSGIGPKTHLEQLGLPILSNLQVGKQMITHPSLIGLKFILHDIVLPNENQRENLIEYLESGTGPLTAFSVHLATFFKSNATTTKFLNTNSDYELAFVPSRKKTQQGDRLVVSINVILLHPRSRGSVKVSDADPFSPPLIDPNFYSDKDDLDIKIMLEGIRMVERFMRTEIFADLGTKIDMSALPSCPGTNFDSDDFWKCVIRKKTVCLSDAAATAKMGPGTDSDAVVDDKLRVYGIDHLRVVDNSVIPVSLAAHMMAPAYMIGEKAASMIINYWNASK